MLSGVELCGLFNALGILGIWEKEWKYENMRDYLGKCVPYVN